MKRIETLPYFAPSVLSLKMNTIYNCYHEYPKIASFWQEENAFLCHFGNKITIVGKCNWDSVRYLANFLGAKHVEMLSDNGKTVLIHDCKHFDPSYIHPTEDYNAAYKTICSVDQTFPILCPRLEFVADMTLRYRKGLAHTFTYDDTTALITCEDDEYCLLGTLAKDPFAPKGNGAKLLNSVISYCGAKSKSLYVIAENDKLVNYYRSFGFVPVEKVLDLKI